MQKVQKQGIFNRQNFFNPRTYKEFFPRRIKYQQLTFLLAVCLSLPRIWRQVR